MADEITDTSQTVAAGQLRAFIERIERLEEEKQTLADDIKEVFAEMKGTGFDTKAVRTIIRLRKQDQAERQEAEAILELYMAALGMEKAEGPPAPIMSDRRRLAHSACVPAGRPSGTKPRARACGRNAG